MKFISRLIAMLLITAIVVTGCHMKQTDSSGISSSTSCESTAEESTADTTASDTDTSDTSDTDDTSDTSDTDDTSDSSFSDITTSDPEITDSDNEESTESDISSDSSEDPDTSLGDTTDVEELPTPPENTIFSEAMSKVSARHCFIYNVDSDELLALKGSGVNISPASVTKLLTSLYALQAVPNDLVISPKSEELSLVGTGSSIAYVKSHHKLTVKQLVEGMLLPSGNDAAYALAAGVARYLNNDPNMPGADAVRYFMEKMSEYAASIGCTGTNFTVPDGLAGSEHYTSVHDLIIIGKLAISNPIISKYASTVSEKVYYVSPHNITWTNSNLLIHPDSEYYSPYVTGLKTGSLSGNNCVYISAVIEGQTYLIGVFGAPERNGRYVDAHIIIDAILETNKAGS